MNILIIDVGTSSIRGILFDKQGKMLYIAQKEYGVISLLNGGISQNPLDFKDGMIEVIQKVTGFAKENNYTVDAIAITSQRSSVIPVDDKGNHLCDALMWQDKRTVPLCHELSEYHREIFNICGSRVNPVFSGTRMKWLKLNEPDIYNKAYKLPVIPDYLVYHMTGNFYTDDTYGSRSLLMNLKTRKWDERLLELLDVEEEKLCEIKPVGSIMGYTTQSFGRLAGLSSSIPVISAGGDQQCGMLGQGVVEMGNVSLTLGTGGFLLTTCKDVPGNLDWNVVCNSSSISGKYILEANMLTCTSAMEWFKHNFYSGEPNFYSRMNEILTEVPTGSNGCRVLPYFQGRSTPDWNSNATASFRNITLNTSREDMLKALLEGICMEINNNIHSFESYVDIDKVLINGGLSKSEAFNQMQADVYGKKLLRMDNTESTAIGALMVAGITLGIYKDEKEAFDIIHSSMGFKEYTPDAQKHSLYIKIQDEMNNMYNAQ